MPWDVYPASQQVATWIQSLSEHHADAFLAAVELLEEHAPMLGRPYADRLHGSRHHKLKELRPRTNDDSELRVLFALTTDRRGALLVGGHKARGGQWNAWYERWIPVADDLLDRIEREIAAGGDT